MKRETRIALIAVPLILGIGLFMGQLSNSGYGNDWFDQLAKPDAMPPGWAFGTAWTILYVLMGMALALVLSERSSNAKWPALTLFAVQLALNYSWSPIFFGSHRVELGLAVIVTILLLTIPTAIAFAKINRLAGWLLAPYVVWLCFAAYLNFEIWRLNPSL